MPRPLRWAVPLLAKALAAFFLWWMLTRGATVLTAWGFLLSIGLVVAAGFYPLMAREKARGIYRAHRDQFPDCRIYLSEHGLFFESGAERGSRGWETISLVADTPAGLLFLDGSREVVLWLPLRAFDEHLTPEQVRSLLGLVGIPVRKVA